MSVSPPPAPPYSSPPPAPGAVGIRNMQSRIRGAFGAPNIGHADSDILSSNGSQSGTGGTRSVVEEGSLGSATPSLPMSLGDDNPTSSAPGLFNLPTQLDYHREPDYTNLGNPKPKANENCTQAILNIIANLPDEFLRLGGRVPGPQGRRTRQDHRLTSSDETNDNFLDLTVSLQIATRHWGTVTATLKVMMLDAHWRDDEQVPDKHPPSRLRQTLTRLVDERLQWASIELNDGPPEEDDFCFYAFELIQKMIGSEEL